MSRKCSPVRDLRKDFEPVVSASHYVSILQGECCFILRSECSSSTSSQVPVSMPFQASMSNFVLQLVLMKKTIRSVHQEKGENSNLGVSSFLKKWSVQGCGKTRCGKGRSHAKQLAVSRSVFDVIALALEVALIQKSHTALQTVNA